jgi:hypothetical protein
VGSLVGLELAALFLVWDVHFGIVSVFNARECRGSYTVVEDWRHPQCHCHSCWLVRGVSSLGHDSESSFPVPSPVHDADGLRQWFSLTGDGYGVLLSCLGTS